MWLDVLNHIFIDFYSRGTFGSTWEHLSPSFNNLKCILASGNRAAGTVFFYLQSF